MDPKCSYMRFFAICQLLIVSQVSAKLETKWGFFSKKQPNQVILISSLQAWLIVMRVSSLFCGYMYICQFFSDEFTVCPEYIHGYLSWKGLFLRTPFPRNFLEIPINFINFVKQNAYPNPKEIPIPSVEGEGVWLFSGTAQYLLPIVLCSCFKC